MRRLGHPDREAMMRNDEESELIDLWICQNKECPSQGWPTIFCRCKDCLNDNEPAVTKEDHYP